jgi:hypothetical protein
MNKEVLIALGMIVLLFSGCVDQGTEVKDISVKDTTTSTSTTTTSSTSTTSSTEAVATTLGSVPSSTTTTSTTSSTSTSFAARKIEVVFFYPSSPCANCIEVGDLAEQTIDTYYMEEVSDGRLVFKKANYFDPANRELIKKYGPESSSLWIGTYDQGRFYKEMKIAVWYKTGNAKDYMEYLKGAIDARLEGGIPDV